MYIESFIQIVQAEIQTLRNIKDVKYQGNKEKLHGTGQSND